MKKKKVGRLTFTNLKIIIKSTVIKVLQYWHHDKQINVTEYHPEM